jgi:hypothetical protein
MRRCFEFAGTSQRVGWAGKPAHILSSEEALGFAAQPTCWNEGDAHNVEIVDYH